MQATGFRARVATQADYPAFQALLEQGWPGSAGYHVSILRHWSNHWPDILASYEAFLVLESPAGTVGYAGVKRQDASYSTLPQALVDHFVLPQADPGESLGQVARALIDWARLQGFAKVTLTLEPAEHAQRAALERLGFHPDRVALLSYHFPHPPAHPAIRPMRDGEYPRIVDMGARLAEHIASYPGSVQQLSLDTHQELTDKAYRDYGATRPHVFLVAEHEGRVVGFFYVVFEAPNGGLLYDVYVEPECRRMGFFRALSEQGSEWLYQLGARYLVTYVHSANTPSRTFFEGWGFKPYFTAWDFNL